MHLGGVALVHDVSETATILDKLGLPAKDLAHALDSSSTYDHESKEKIIVIVWKLARNCLDWRWCQEHQGLNVQCATHVQVAKQHISKSLEFA